MRITFAGAAGTVTGARYLVEADRTKVLVDCGLFQGIKSLRLRNWQAPPFDPEKLDAVVLTHAHIDHTGYLPRLVAQGYKGPVYCSRGTRDLLHILLPDAGYLQEEEARRANKYEYTSHHPALPLYTRAEAEACLQQLVPVDYYERFEPAPGVEARFTRAGHIIGSSSLALTMGGRTIAFSGDVGRANDPIMKQPDPLPPCDYMVVESTYGDRLHPDEDVLERLATLVNETVSKGGTMVVPAFAVGRAQHLLHLLSELRLHKRIPDVPVYLDSPMAIAVTHLLDKHVADYTLSAEQRKRLSALPHYTAEAEDSKRIDRSSDPKIIVSASGMATGGRVLHHLRRFLPDPQNTVLIVGFQPAGTRGRALLDGSDELKFFGQYVRVRARVANIQGLSAHADRDELLAWLKRSDVRPKRVFVTHGEPTAADAFRRKLRDTFGFKVEVPDDGSSYELE